MTYLLIALFTVQALGLLVGAAALQAAGRADRALELAGPKRSAA